MCYRHPAAFCAKQLRTGSHHKRDGQHASNTATRDIPVEGGGTIEDKISRANRIYGRVGLKYEQNRNWWGLVQTRWHDDYDDIATHPSDSDAKDIRMTVAGNPDGSMPGYTIVDIMCKGRWFCPSCHQKKVKLFGALPTETIIPSQ